MLLPKQLKPWLDFGCFAFTGRDIDTNTRKSSLKKMQQDSESKESKSHTETLLKSSLSCLENEPRYCRRALRFRSVHSNAVL